LICGGITIDTIEVIRDKPVPVSGPVHGKIRLNGIDKGVTLENGDRKIAAGEYSAKIYDSPKFNRKVILLDDANGRTAIEIHAGNRISDTTGCILIGSSRHGDEIWSSSAALNALIKAIRTPNNIKVYVR
jgi:hypothetical protein